MLRLPRLSRLERLADLCVLNADALLASLHYCALHGIGAFRINSQILPLKTHPQAGYQMSELPRRDEIVARFRECGVFARDKGIRLSFHPDQFVVLNSPNRKTLAHSLAELSYQAEVAEWVGADSINIHGGGAYGDKAAALRTLRENIERLPASVRSRLTLENDNTIFTPSDLLPVCADTGVPLVYDVHHHRCLPDDLGVAAATERALATWNREPLFHISSPLEGWQGPKPQRHHDHVDLRDFPMAWQRLVVTVEVEAKAKKLAVLKLLAWMGSNRS
jgi:UV DNA damage endonuclease